MVNDFLTDAGTVIRTPWGNKTVLQKAYTVAFALLVIAVLPLPYAYYTSMRLGICVCLYLYYREAKRHENLHPAWTYGLVSLALLYNPLVPIHIGVQVIWTVLNAGTVFFLYRARLVMEAIPRDDVGEQKANAVLAAGISDPSAEEVRDRGPVDYGRALTASSWAQSFALYYIGSELRYHTRGDLPDTIVELLTGSVSQRTEQSVLANLQMYLSFAYQRDRGPDDYGRALTALRTVGRTEMQQANTPSAVRRWISQAHKHETQSDITEAELEQQLAEIHHDISLDKSKALSLQTLVFKGLIESLFEGRHGRAIKEFSDDVLSAYGATLQRGN